MPITLIEMEIETGEVRSGWYIGGVMLEGGGRKGEESGRDKVNLGVVWCRW